VDEAELRIALGPAGAVGLLVLIVGLLRRRPLLIAVGAFAVAADLKVSKLRGFAAARSPGAK
jgi:hypothetical protein